ncbi:Hypothetical protein HEAR0678 [Herminiimonas arsenicoxydans]|uniref:Uncharacterized protein n=1 Tax=Herminiimonas arsenicoxydans TaxID=204773 RepID=A4G2Y5_HERAR|nr:Hypothetical protein HEAR0678 [Herminiimonas arsenicoxydans]
MIKIRAVLLNCTTGRGPKGKFGAQLVQAAISACSIFVLRTIFLTWKFFEKLRRVVLTSDKQYYPTR